MAKLQVGRCDFILVVSRTRYSFVAALAQPYPSIPPHPISTAFHFIALLLGEYCIDPSLGAEPQVKHLLPQV